MNSSVSQQSPIPLQQNTSSAKSFYRPELDVLRFVAFVMVMIFHLAPDSADRYHSVHSVLLKDLLACLACSMAFGVCLFFVLSAFLITTLLLRERQTTSTVNLTAFYKRRMLRIWPLYFLALGLAFSACSLVHGFPGYRVIAAYLFMSGNLLAHFHVSVYIRPLKIFHLWSISVEEQFYCLFPAVASFLNTRLFLGISGVIGATAIIALIHLTGRHASKEEVWQNSFVQFLMFAAGIAIAVFLSSRPLPNFSGLVRIFYVLLGFVSCFSAQYFCRIGGQGSSLSASHAVVGYILVMLGCSALLIATVGYSGWLPQTLIYLGKISYGLYVFHIWCISLAAFLIAFIFHISMAEGSRSPMAVLGKDALAFALTIATATLSYRLIERPFLIIKRRFELVPSRRA